MNFWTPAHDALIARIVSGLRRARKITGTPPVHVDDGPHGRSVSIALPDVRYGKLNSVGTFTEQVFSPTSGWTPAPGAVTDKAFAVTSPAANGQVVRLMGIAPGDWRYDYPRTCASLCVILKDASGNGISGASITLTPSSGSNVTGQTDPGGYLCLGGLAAGLWTVAVSGVPGQTLANTQVNLANNCCCQYALSWSGGTATPTPTACCQVKTICVQVTICAGDGTQGLNVNLPVSVTFNGNTVASGQTDSNGKFCFPNVYGNGTYAATVTWNGITKTITVGPIDPTTYAPGTTIVTVHYVGKVTVSVAGCDGPLSGASVTVTNCGGGTTAAAGTVTCTASADLATTGYTVTVTYKNRTQTANVTDGTCNPVFTYVDRLCGCLNDGCSQIIGNVGLPKGSVNLNWSGHDLGTVTPASNGYWCIAPLPWGILNGDTISWSASAPNYLSLSGTFTAGCTSNWFNGSPAGDPCPTLVGGGLTYGSVSITLNPDSSHCCQDLCTSGGIVFLSTMHVNDGLASTAIVANSGGPGSPNGCVWGGCDTQRTAARAVSSQTCPLPTNNTNVAVGFIFDGVDLYINVPGSLCWPVGGCNAADASKTCPLPQGARITTGSNFSNVTRTVNSCDPVDISWTFTPINAALGFGVVYGCGTPVTVHLTA